MPQLNVLELAKQGNVKALAALMNRSLQPRALPLSKPLRIVALKSCWNLPSAESANAGGVCPATIMRAGPIKQMKLYVRQTGEEFPAWSQELEFAGQLACGVTKSSATCPIRKCKAIAALMNRSLQPKGIVKATTLRMVAFKFCWNLLKCRISRSSGIDP